MNKPKILYVFCSENFSGAEIVIKRLIFANTENVETYVLCPPGEFSNSLKKNASIHVIEEKSLLSLNRTKHTYSKIKLFNIVIYKMFKITKTSLNLLKKDFFAVHCNNLSAALYCLPCLLINKLTKSKTKWFWSNHDINYFNGSSTTLASIRHFFYNRTFAVSNAVKLMYPKYNNKIDVLYNGLDTQEFSFDQKARNNFRDKYSIPNNVILIGIVGLVSEVKGHIPLINAFINLIKLHPSIGLFIIGKTPPGEEDYEIKIRKLASHLQQNSFFITGPQKNMPEVYSGLDIVVNATTTLRSEPLGTSICEAMSCKRIIVASNTGGTPEIIEDKKNGFLFSSSKDKELEKVLSFVISNFHSMDNIKEEARIKILKDFNIDKVVLNYNKLIN